MRAVLPSLALVVFWSSGFVGARLGTTYAPADTLLTWRYLIAAALLLAVLRLRGVRSTRAAWRRQGALGLLCQVGYLGGIVTGVGLGVPAGTAALIAALQPLVVAVLVRDAVTRHQLVGVLGGVVGVLLVVGGDLSAGGAWWTYLLPIGGMLALSVGTALDESWNSDDGLLESLTLQTVVAAVVFTAAASARSSLIPPTDPAFWWSVAWVVGLSSFGGYGAYLLVLRRSGPVRVSTMLYLTPPTTMAWAALMFGDPVSMLGVVGTAVCAASVIVVLRSTRHGSAGAPARSRSATACRPASTSSRSRRTAAG